MNEQRAILIADLGYGDAGKGSIVDALTRSQNAHCVVRYNGGAQAAHHVVTPDGRQHVFAQFGSGTFVPGVRTHLSRYMLLHPLAMLAEERHLQAVGVHDAFQRTSIERAALVITPFQQAANRLKELARGDQRHGSCGLGIGETMADSLAAGAQALTAGDLPQRALVIRKLRALRDAKIAELAPVLAALDGNPAAEAERRVLFDPDMVEISADLFAHFASQVELVEAAYLKQLLAGGVTLFEGAQGVLLDEWWGFTPYTTWSTLTYRNAQTLLDENGWDGEGFKLGLLRGYATRHGPGPFVTEDKALTALLPDTHNQDNPWQRSFRVGYLDLVALRYAVRVIGALDGLVVTNLDRMAAMPTWQICDAYRGVGEAAGLEDFFAQRDGTISDIRLPDDPTDLQRQAQLTRALLAAQPVYRECPRQRPAYLQAIQNSLGVPVLMTSAGPTALEKESFGLLQPVQAPTRGPSVFQKSLSTACQDALPSAI